MNPNMNPSLNLPAMRRLKAQRGGQYGQRAVQRGVVMLEALLAILIFSVGILAVVGMQGSAVTAVTDSKYRSDASMLAGNLIGQMWSSINRRLNADPTINAQMNLANLQTSFQGGGPPDGALYTAWLNNTNSGVKNVLPNVGSNKPLVTVNTGTGDVSITIYWTPPDNPNAVAHNYNIVTNIQP